jgi:hypothetical protein
MPERDDQAPAGAAGPDARAAAEDLCRRCGACCHEKVVLGEEIYLTDVPCRHLDPETNLCRIYRSRLDRNRRCLSVAEGIARRAFPADCPYVRHLADYRPPVRLPPGDPAAPILARLVGEE